MGKTREITVDFDAKCDQCGQKGATPAGICLRCAAKRISKKARNRVAKGDQTMAKQAKPKPVTVELLPRDRDGEVPEPYRLMDDLIGSHHPHLAEAKIAICWRYTWTEDADGRLQVAQCKKGSDLDRELHGHDFVILLNHEVWNAGTFDTDQQIAVLDHQLCHAQVSVDSDGEWKYDEKERPVYRIRQHDVEEFTEVVARRGLYMGQLEQFAAAFMEREDRPLLKVAEEREAG